MKTHSILPNRVVVRRRFTAKLKKMRSLTCNTKTQKL